MADKKPEKKDDKKAPPAESPFGPELKALLWVIGIIVFLSLFLTNSNAPFLKIFSQSEGIKVGDTVILKEDVFVRSAPGDSILGKQKKYETATVQEGPINSYNQSWWKLNFKKAPDGWVPSDVITKYVGTYKTLHIFPITWKFVKPFLYIFGIIMLILLIAAKLQLKILRKDAEEKLAPAQSAQAKVTPHIIVGENEQKEVITAGDRRSNERWMHIVQLLQSHNQNDWRQAIIEADIILEEMLEKMGYDGVTIGDKLKNVEPSDFRTLNQAWEAHKIRNRIAHMGMEFRISHAEAEKTINLYQEVFDEFYYI